MKIAHPYCIETRLWLQRHAVTLRIATFAALFAALQVGWEFARGSVVERMVIDSATVKPAVTLINWLTPTTQAVAVGAALRAPGGGLNILNGCEGVESLFLLLAAFAAAPLACRYRAAGLVVGTVLVYVLNVIRVVALFYVWRNQKFLFDTLHGMVAPIVMVLIIAAYFHAALNAAGVAAGRYAQRS